MITKKKIKGKSKNTQSGKDKVEEIKDVYEKQEDIIPDDDPEIIPFEDPFEQPEPDEDPIAGEGP